MRFRREPLHVKLAREGGLDLAGHHPAEATRPWPEVGIHGVPRPRRWDAVTTRDVAELTGDRAQFVVLPDGSLLVEDGPDDQALAALADGLDLEPPYRAEAVRRDGTVWAAAARRIEVAELPDAPPDAEHVELAVHSDERSLRVDGTLVFGGRLSTLEQLADARYEAYVAEAQRLDGDLWEIHLAPL
jgi:hypothetical protein